MDSYTDITSRPIPIPLPGREPAYIKIDKIFVIDDLCIITGWQSDSINFKILSDGNILPVLFSSSFMRPDVNSYLNSDAAIRHGFTWIIPYRDMNNCKIENDLISIPLNLGDIDCCQPDGIVGEEAQAFVSHYLAEAKSGQNIELASNSPLKCALDHAMRWPDVEMGNPIILCGWQSIPPDSTLCAGSGQKIFPLELYNFSRPDIAKSFDVYPGYNSKGNGFIALLENYPIQESKVTIYLDKGDVKIPLAEKEISTFYSYRNFLKKLFEIDFPYGEMAFIYENLFIPFMAKLQEKRVDAIMANTWIVREKIGQVPSAPAISLVVPLYGSLDHLEAQLKLLVWDTYFKTNAELIYVISDPGIYDQFKMKIYECQEKYAISCAWIYAHNSLGFAEACNLGATKARGNFLVFLNSDVCPQRPGWLRDFQVFLEDNPGAGLAGCHLDNPDNTPQHRGGVLRLNAYMGVYEYINLLDAHGDDPYEVPFVTGACIAMRRDDFRAVRGFSTQYIIGNSEDLDLCEKIRSIGKNIWCLPKVRMTHYNHHSFNSLDQGKWLDRLWFCNALIYRLKWHQEDFRIALNP